MSLFGLFKKRKEKPIPEPPKPPVSVPQELKFELPQASRHTDDLEKPAPETKKGPLFPELPKLELPEIGPAKEEKELPPAGKYPGMPKIELPEIEMPEEEKARADEEYIPEQLPEIEEFEAPEEIPEELPALEGAGALPARKRAPLFINVNAYSEMIDQLNVTRAKLNEYASAAARVIDTRAKKEAAMEKWRDALEDIERKLLGIDRLLFEGG